MNHERASKAKFEFDSKKGTNELAVNPELRLVAGKTIPHPILVTESGMPEKNQLNQSTLIPPSAL